MHIVYDHQIFALQRYGGISRYFAELASEIAALGHRVEIFAPLYVNELIRTARGCELRGLHLAGKRSSPRLRSVVNQIFTPIFYATRRRASIVHETYYAAHASSPPHARRILTVYDLVHEKFPESASDRLRHKKRVSVDRADHIICISENTRRDLVEMLGVPTDKTSVVHLAHSFAGRVGVEAWSGPRPYFLHVGPRDSYKNFNVLQRAFARTSLARRDHDVVCFGGGPLTAHEKRTWESIGLNSDRLIQIDGDDDVLAALYKGASALVYPSLYEGFGIPPLEAMAMGCPVICAPRSSLPEVVGDAAELFDPDDDDSLASALDLLLSSPSRVEQLRDAGRRQAATFSWQRCAEETLAVYEQVLAATN